VILIVTDDQGYGDLSCHGNPILRTPNLDRLHAQSVRFTNFHTDPTCSPTRSALMTGRYSTRVGVWHTVMGRHMPRRDISTRFDEFAEIEIGTDRQDPVPLTCFEWHSSQRWSQSNVRSGFEDNGFWALHIAAAGTYEFVLRRWPAELDAPITAAVDGGRAIRATRARIHIGDLDQSAPVSDAASHIRFELALQPGKTRLQTWFIDPDGRSRGAYYVTVRRRR
jgi:hypothetical protein